MKAIKAAQELNQARLGEGENPEPRLITAEEVEAMRREFEAKQA